MDREHEAEPQSLHDAGSASRCPEVVTAAQERGITSIVHFTTIGGLKGILASGAVRSRRDLPGDEVADDDGYEAVEAALIHFPYAPKINKDPEAFR